MNKFYLSLFFTVCFVIGSGCNPDVEIIEEKTLALDNESKFIQSPTVTIKSSLEATEIQTNQLGVFNVTPRAESTKTNTLEAIETVEPTITKTSYSTLTLTPAKTSVRTCRLSSVAYLT